MSFDRPRSKPRPRHGRSRKRRKLTGAPIRDIGFAAWWDELAPLEHMRGRRWRHAIRTEATYAAQFNKHSVVSKRTRAFEKILQITRGRDTHPWIFSAGAGAVDISPNGTLSLLWKWHGEPAGTKTRSAEDLDATSTHIWYLHDGNGSENYTLIAEGRTGRVLWKRHNVGTEVAVVDGRVYYTRCGHVQWANRVCSADADTGLNERVELETADEHEGFELIRARDHALFIKKKLRNGYTILYELDRSTGQISLFDDESYYQIPGAHGVVLRITRRPETIGFEEDDPYYIDPVNDFMLASKYGNQYILSLDPQKPAELWHEFGATLIPDKWSAWDSQTSPARIFVRSPKNGMQLLIVDKGNIETFELGHPFGTNTLKVSEHSARSHDGTTVKYALVFDPASTSHPRKLLVYGYGAYGIPTRPGNIWSLWGPLLREGWGIAYAYIRGGGDGPLSWYHAGRRENRIKGIEDFEAVIGAARKVLSVPSERTVISGRSAGGLLVGQCTVRNPGGDLFGATFTEVPFVDILRTMTNPELPLTNYESHEFGAPHQSLADFGATLNVSPVDNVPNGGVPGVFVIVRTGGTDTEVYPYEGLKFVLRARAGAVPKIFQYKADEGHFYSGDADIKARATDLATIDAWADGQLSGFRPPEPRQEKIAVQGIQMARSMSRKNRTRAASRKNRSSTRKNRAATRKNRAASRKNRSNRKNRN